MIATKLQFDVFCLKKTKNKNNRGHTKVFYNMMKVGHHIRRAKKLKQKMKINPRVKV
jgi:hypothetical protein